MKSMVQYSYHFLRNACKKQNQKKQKKTQSKLHSGSLYVVKGNKTQVGSQKPSPVAWQGADTKMKSSVAVGTSDNVAFYLEN